MRFHNRCEAGLVLQHHVRPLLHQPATIYAMPRGGVPVACELALHLDTPIDLVVVRKIGAPRQPERAIAAVSESGHAVYDERERHHFDPLWLDTRVAVEHAEARRRRALYNAGHARSFARDHCAIIVDDGIATGLSMRAAIAELRADEPRRLIVAVPVAAREAVLALEPLVDAVIVAQLPRQFSGAVGDYYEDFHQLDDDEVLAELQRARTVVGPHFDHTAVAAADRENQTPP